MHNKLFVNDPNWYRAFTLKERLAALPSTNEVLSKGASVDENVERKIKQWASQEPFNKNGYFKQRLANDGIEESTLRYLLNEPMEVMQERLEFPDWLSDIFDAYENPYPPVFLPEQPESPHLQQVGGFSNLVMPLINRAGARLRDGIEQLLHTFPLAPFELETAVSIFLKPLPQLLISILHRTLILELNVARLEDKLHGSNAEERYQDFLSQLLEPKFALKLLQEYPIIARQTTIILNNWVTFNFEFLNHLCTDWSTICNEFSLDQKPGNLVNVKGNAGDRHRNGRSVLITEFSSGFRLVYKPRSLAIEKQFQHLLSWLNSHNAISFQTINIIDRGSYGWGEYINNKPCQTPQEVTRFYERQGGYLALLYALEATDFHYENLIASGEHPVLVDLESLFHPRVADSLRRQQSDLFSGNMMAYSVLRIGLLPQRLWVDEESDGVEISGLSATPGQLSPTPIVQWKNTGTDEMHIVRERMPLSGSQNRPTLNGDEINVLDHVDAITDGFCQIYSILLSHQEKLSNPNGLLASFLQHQIRVILRPTRTYAVLLQESYHPDLLRNALDRERFFDKLWVGIEEDNNYLMPKVIPHERQDLLNGDIPLFTSRPNSRHLWSSSGECIPDFFDESAWAFVQDRLQQLSNADLENQLWFIRASLATLTSAVEQPKLQAYLPSQPKQAAECELLFSAAEKVGRRLESLALKSQDKAHWVGLTPITQNHNAVVSLGSDLYSGLPGIILFLAHLGNLTDEPRYTRLAKAGFNSWQEQIDQNRSSLTPVGAYNGWGGMIYTLANLSNLWQAPSLLEEAVDIVQLLPPLIEKDTTFDVVGGAAGCIVSLATLYKLLPDAKIVDVLTQCGEHLLKTAQPMQPGLGWLSKKMTSRQPLTGMSHGGAGIAWALFELANLTGENRFYEAAIEAIRYERSLYSPEAQNWFDLRENSIPSAGTSGESHKCTVAWCHGAPGIGLARLLSLPYFEDQEVLAEIQTALHTTRAQGFGMSHCLCHGDLGNLELFLLAKDVIGDSNWDEFIAHLVPAILDSFEDHGWLCGNPLWVEEPGLMTGLAGIGYQLLRLAKPEMVPSVLALEAPNQFESDS